MMYDYCCMVDACDDVVCLLVVLHVKTLNACARSGESYASAYIRHSLNSFRRSNNTPDATAQI